MSLFKRFFSRKQHDRLIDNSDWVFVETDPSPPSSPPPDENVYVFVPSEKPLEADPPPLPDGGDTSSSGGNVPRPPPPPPGALLPFPFCEGAYVPRPSSGGGPPTPPPPPPLPSEGPFGPIPPPPPRPPPPPGIPTPPPPPPPRPTPPPPFPGRGRAVKKSNVKPVHWIKTNRALQGSLWAELQKSEEPQSASEFDVSELESLFSNAPMRRATNCASMNAASSSKPEKVQLINLRRANDTEIMLTKVKMPLPELVAAALDMDETKLDVDQLENILKFCPTKEEMDQLKNYTGDLELLGKCEHFFLELMKVPRMEAKLNAFMFKIKFKEQLEMFKNSLNIVYSACDEVRRSNKLKEIMKRILNLGNTINQGTGRGAAAGFKLDSLLKLMDTRSVTSRMTLMHDLCKVIDSRSPGLLNFHRDLGSLEAATKIQLKQLAEEMQFLITGLEKVKKELDASTTEGPVSKGFRTTAKEFIRHAEAEVRSVTNFYSVVVRDADALALYIGEDPARSPFEQATQTLLNFARLFQKCHEENLKNTELERKKAEVAAMGTTKGIILTKRR